MDTNARGFWLVKWTLGWKNFMPENSLEISRYFALTSYYNTVGQLNNAFYILGFAFWWENEEAMFWSFIHCLIKQITNTYQHHFSRSYENRSNCLKMLCTFSFWNPYCIDCKQSLFYSKICEQYYCDIHASMQVVRLWAESCAGAGRSRKRACSGFIQHFWSPALWWWTNGRSWWCSSVINNSSTKLRDPPQALNKWMSCWPGIKAPKTSATKYFCTQGNQNNG